MEDKKFFKEIELFFLGNIKLKEELMNMAPPYVNDYYALKNYSNQLRNFFKEQKQFFLRFNKTIFNDTLKGQIENIFDKINLKLDDLKKDNCFDYNVIKNFYYDNIAKLDMFLVEDLNENCFGYSLDNHPSLFIDKCKTINDLLHLFHTCIVNNEDFYGKMPLIYKKSNKMNYPISLYGEKQDIALDIFDKFPLELDAAWVDILSIPSSHNIIMLIRDRGHALSIQIDVSNEDYIYVNYYIPKICNVDMVNELKGVRKVDEQSNFTRGCFATNKEKIAIELFDFISKVPTDLDIKNKQM